MSGMGTAPYGVLKGLGYGSQGLRPANWMTVALQDTLVHPHLEQLHVMRWQIFWALGLVLAAMGISLSMVPRCNVDQMVPREVTAQRHGACHPFMETSTA